MKELNELNLPNEVLYSEEHEWAKPIKEKIRVGISDYAQDQMGDIVFVEMPEEGLRFGKGDAFGTLESVKAVTELYMPVSGEIIGINHALEDSPELVNQSPYADGWIVEINPDNQSELDTLMDNEAYLNMLKGAGK